MSEVLVKFDEAIPRADGVKYFAQAMARERTDRLWEGWLEFLPVEGSAEEEWIPSGRETTQPNRDAVMYWAQGLSRVYLMGSLERAVAPTAAIEREREGFYI